MKYDEPVDVLTNYDYVLFDTKYLPVLGTLAGQVDSNPVTVVDTVRKQTWDNYVEVSIHVPVDMQTIYEAPAEGLGIYLFNHRHVFVSEALKQEFEKIDNQRLAFSLGLSMFG
ncbi:hypothetical protein [Hymenobacter cellulosilyticus]|uniref:Uncharacterized protein n=1 Tax=Hymenobacter cellulosilyticus TaxID=2932248 RepID=A0A8T9QB40_9BACT|nr:hypothetical protein [Hymenobacter cellulosilyticus]UOQ74776.1 hypothetical protein MUN79_13430 [Hymenobacter cellulosilyticus]